MHAILAVQLRVELLFPTNLFTVEEYGGALGARPNVTEMFNDDHDCRLLIDLAFFQLLLPVPGSCIAESRGLFQQRVDWQSTSSNRRFERCLF